MPAAVVDRREEKLCGWKHWSQAIRVQVNSLPNYSVLQVEVDTGSFSTAHTTFLSLSFPFPFPHPSPFIQTMDL